MNKHIYFVIVLVSLFVLEVFAQKGVNVYKTKTISKTLYSGKPNHVELTEKSLSLAVEAGFNDTVDISLNEIKARLETGAYSEDYDIIPGIVGENFPQPWTNGPDFDFNELYPFTKIPYGSISDTLSGWFRGLSHGYDPVNGFKWPGANSTTLDWANSINNSFTWNKAIELYKSGNKAEAYECLGHVLHLLADLSIPAHVRLVNHGISINKIKSGTIIAPDLLFLIVDEYELALSGGVSLPNVITLIPNLLDDFRQALNSAEYQNIPNFYDWKDYLTNIALYTYNDSTVNQFYSAPQKNGNWGYIKDKDGNLIKPKQYGITPVAKIGNRWSQISIMSTASIGHSSFIPEDAMVAIVNNLAPKQQNMEQGLYYIFSIKLKPLQLEMAFIKIIILNYYRIIQILLIQQLHSNSKFLNRILLHLKFMTYLEMKLLQ